MKHILLTITLNFGAMSLNDGSHRKHYKFPKKDCQEMLGGIGGLLEEADKQWAYLQNLTIFLSDLIVS